MSNVVRFGISLEKELCKKFDKYIKEKRYPNRSQAFRSIIRELFVEKEWKENKEIIGAIALVYDHHKRELVNKLMDIQHDFNHLIISTQHIHIDHHNCFEVIVVRGKSNEVIELKNMLKGTKGVKHCELSMSTKGSSI